MWSAILLKPIFGNHWFKNWAILAQKLKAQYLDPIIRFTVMSLAYLWSTTTILILTLALAINAQYWKWRRLYPTHSSKSNPLLQFSPPERYFIFLHLKLPQFFKLINSTWLLFRWRTVQQRAVVTGPGRWRVERRTYTLNSTRMQKCTVTVSS